LGLAAWLALSIELGRGQERDVAPSHPTPATRDRHRPRRAAPIIAPRRLTDQGRFALADTAGASAP